MGGHVLVCDECDAISEHGRGWQAHLSVGDEHSTDEEEVAILCPVCGGREFEDAV
jgi:hypothetical protein